MGLNSRKAQIVMGALPIVTLSLFIFFPFVWRALKTRRASDIRLAVLFSAAELAGLVGLSLSPTTHKDGPDNLIAMLMWVVILAATVTAAYLYRPLSKDERMDQAARDARPGSSYLN
jgi:cyanate permease